jgi:hypothetical protein
VRSSICAIHMATQSALFAMPFFVWTDGDGSHPNTLRPPYSCERAVLQRLAPPRSVLWRSAPGGANLHRGDFRHRLGWPQTGSVDIGDGVVRDALLFVVYVKDGRAIAGAYVIALPVARCRIVNLEEESRDCG